MPPFYDNYRAQNILRKSEHYALTHVRKNDTLCVQQPRAIDHRVQIRMDPGDEALVFRLVLPAGSPRLNPQDKGQILCHVSQGHWELDMLRRRA